MKKDTKNLIWLASYPKSGNTWVRLFLQCIFQGEPDPDSFPSLSAIPIASNRKLIDDMLGIRSANLSQTEIAKLRPDVYRALSEKGGDTQVIKVHDCYENIPGCGPLFPPEVSRQVIYIIRNPLDLVVSYAFHSGKSFDRIIAQLNDSSFMVSESVSGLHAQVPQHLGSWSGHVSSWIEQKDIGASIVRFEDLLTDPEPCFMKILKNSGISFEKDIFNLALEATSFSQLRAREKAFGFQEKPLQSKAFFRSGRAGDHQKHLSNKQIQKVIKVQGTMMEKYGYKTTI